MDIEWLEPWYPVGDCSRDALESELGRELVAGHPLYGLPVVALGRRNDQDDVLFRLDDETGRLAVVHLTWTHQSRIAPHWPHTTVYESLEDWKGQCMDRTFLARRIHAMALVLLTSRNDLSVIEVGDTIGIDLLVSIRKEKIRAIEQFGVILQGTVQEANAPYAASQQLNALMPKNPRFEPISIPICVFFFSMVGDPGYYAWLYEPATTNGIAKLRRHSNLECKSLDEEALEEIVDRVDRYFGALTNSLVC
jgi:hypothetical protein